MAPRRSSGVSTSSVYSFIAPMTARSASYWRAISLPVRHSERQWLTSCSSGGIGGIGVEHARERVRDLAVFLEHGAIRTQMAEHIGGEGAVFPGHELTRVFIEE